MTTNNIRLVHIYGAGKYGKRLLSYLNQINVSVSNFIVTEAKENTLVEGIPVISYNDYMKKNNKGIVLIAIADNKVENDIMIKFKDDGYDSSKVIRMSSFFKIVDNHITENCDCIAFGKKNIQFIETGIDTDLFKKKRIIGGGRRQNARCPICGTIDRYRWINWLLENKTKIYSEPCTVLHFAPEGILRSRITANINCDYYQGDIILKSGQHRIDVTNIQFRDEFFDYVMLNHVLEHVPDDGKALNEIYRVLKKNGHLIISFPIVVGEKTFEDGNIITDEERLKYYGQADHVRLYGELDVAERLEKNGFDVVKYQVKDYFSEDEAVQFGLIHDDIVFICKKIGRLS